MKIDSLDFSDLHLRVKCSGAFGVGSEGNPSGELLRKSIGQRMATYPGERVEQIAIDYTDVDCSWGDGPVSSTIPFLKQGVTKVRLIASPQNRKSLENLVTECNLPWFTVEAA